MKKLTRKEKQEIRRFARWLLDEIEATNFKEARVAADRAKKAGVVIGIDYWIKPDA